MILSSGAGCFTATAGTTTMAAGNTTHEQQLQQQHEPQQLQQHQQSDESTTDFGWWQSQQSVNSLTGHQLPQITSSSPPQQQQFGAGDDFDGFDLSLLISGVSDGLYGDGALDNRVPAAAISATVTVHTNTALNGSGDYYPPTTAVSQQQLQLDLQQLWSLYEEIRQSETSTSPAAVVPSVMDTTDVGTTATATPATTTTTAVAANDGEGNTTKSTLLRSLLTATVSSLPPVSSVPPVCKIESAAPVVESTTEVADAPSAVIDIKTENVEAADNKNHNKHRLLIEMLRGGSNDDVVVPTAVVRPTRRRPHVKAFGPDGADECKAGRRRLDSLPILQTDQIQGLQPDEADDDGLLMYENPYFTASCASPSWLDNMVAAAAAATTDEYNLCFDQASVDGGYYSATTAEYVYSPPAAAQVPSVSPPPSSCGDPSTTTIKIEDCSGMDEQMCWKTAEGTTGSGDFYDRVLMFVREAAASAASPNDDTAISSCIMSSSTDSNSSNSNSNSSVSNMNKISSMEGIQDDASIVSADSEDPDAMANSSFQLSDNLSSVSATSKSFTQTPGKASATVTVTTTTTSSSSSSSLSSPPNIHLWQFMKEMLTASEDDDNIATSTTTAAGTTVNPKQPMIRWLDRKEGIFKIEDSQAVARLWGQRKNRPLMNYDKLSRSLRQYYKKGIMRKTARSQRLVYQFCYPYNA